MTKPVGSSIVESEEELLNINGPASPSTLLKILPALETHTRSFIARSPFLIIASAKKGEADASPRGDEPGFVKVLDDTTILIPERPGNRIADTLKNVLVNPAVGLIFMIPGMNETLRINGDSYITTETDYLDMLTITFPNGRVSKPPKLAILVDIKQVYFHCAKAFIRSKLWDADQHMERGDMPSLGKMLLEQKIGRDATEVETEQLDKLLAEDIRANLY